MATIYLRLSTKSDKATSQHEVLMRFKHGAFAQRAKTNVFVKPDYWNDVTQSVEIPKWRSLTKEKKQLITELQQKSDKLNKMISFVQYSFQALDKSNVADDWLKSIIKEFNKPTVADEVQQPQQPKKSFFDYFELFLESKKYPKGTVKAFRVLERALGRYQGFKREHDKKRFTLEIDKLTKDIINDFFHYFKFEYQYQEKYPDLYKRLLRDNPVEITAKHKTAKITERGHNHVVNLMRKFRTFTIWLNKEGYTSIRPFDKDHGVEIPDEEYGTPIVLTIEERNKIADFDLSVKPHLERQRDVFIFQCLIGCRVGDLLKMNPDNIAVEEGIQYIHYIPRKTRKGKPVTATVPLNKRAVAILNKYRNMDLTPYKTKTNPRPLLPFISSVKYNESLKEIFKLCGIDRMVTVIDPVSGDQVQKPLYEVASSHKARSCFVGNIYNEVQDPKLISSMSGHAMGSKAFERYRDIPIETQKKLVDLIN